MYMQIFMDKDTHFRIIHNNQKLEKTQCPPIDGWINKMMDGKTKLILFNLKK